MEIIQLPLINGKKNYKILILNSHWNEKLNFINENLLIDLTNNPQLKNAKNTFKIPLVLYEIKNQNYFDELKNESFQKLLNLINTCVNEKLKSKNLIKDFEIEKNSNNLVIHFVELKNEIKEDQLNKNYDYDKNKDNNDNLNKNNETNKNDNLNKNQNKNQDINKNYDYDKNKDNNDNLNKNSPNNKVNNDYDNYQNENKNHIYKNNNNLNSIISLHMKYNYSTTQIKN